MQREGIVAAESALDRLAFRCRPDYSGDVGADMEAVRAVLDWARQALAVLNRMDADSSGEYVGSVEMGRDVNGLLDVD